MKAARRAARAEREDRMWAARMAAARDEHAVMLTAWALLLARIAHLPTPQRAAATAEVTSYLLGRADTYHRTMTARHIHTSGSQPGSTPTTNTKARVHERAREATPQQRSPRVTGRGGQPM